MSAFDDLQWKPEAPPLSATTQKGQVHVNWNVQWFHSDGQTFDTTIKLETHNEHSAMVIAAPRKGSGFYGVIPIEKINKMHLGLDRAKEKGAHDLNNENDALFFSVEPEGGTSFDTLDFKSSNISERESISKALGVELQKISDRKQEEQRAKQQDVAERERFEQEMQTKRAEIEALKLEAQQEIQKEIESKRTEFEAQKNETHRAMEQTKAKLAGFLQEEEALKKQQQMERAKMEEDRAQHHEILRKEREEIQRTKQEAEQRVNDMERDQNQWLREAEERELCVSNRLERERKELESMRERLEAYKVEQEAMIRNEEMDLDKRLVQFERSRAEAEQQALTKERALSERLEKERKERAEWDKQQRARYERERADIRAERDRLEEDATRRRREEAMMWRTTKKAEMDEASRANDEAKKLILEREREIVQRLEKEREALKVERKKLDSEKLKEKKEMETELEHWRKRAVDAEHILMEFQEMKMLKDEDVRKKRSKEATNEIEMEWSQLKKTRAFDAWDRLVPGVEQFDEERKGRFNYGEDMLLREEMVQQKYAPFDLNTPIAKDTRGFPDCENATFMKSGSQTTPSKYAGTSHSGTVENFLSRM